MITLLFLIPFGFIQLDTNPKNMLPKTSEVRVWNDNVDKSFGLYEDTIVVGVKNDAGIVNRETLGRIARITDEILKLDGVVWCGVVWCGVASRDVNGFTTITNITSSAAGESGTLKVGPLMPGSATN